MTTIFGIIEDGKIYTDRGGRIICLVCNSTKGVRAKNYLRKDKERKTYLKLFRRCANCESLEVKNNYTGEILKQEIKDITECFEKNEGEILTENLKLQ